MLRQFTSGQQRYVQDRGFPRFSTLPAPAAHYPLDEGVGLKVYERTGRILGPGQLGANITGSPNNAPAWIRDPTAPGGYCLQFFGSGGGANSRLLLNNNVLNEASGSFSFCLWAKYSTSFGSNFPGIFWRGAANSNGPSYGLYVNTSNFNPTAQAADGVSGHGVDVLFSGDFRDSKWHLYAYVMDRTAQLLKISVDGRPFATGSTSSLGSVSTTPFSSGPVFGPRIDGGGLGNYFAGYVCQFRFWHGFALTLGQIREIYETDLFSRPILRKFPR